MSYGEATCAVCEQEDPPTMDVGGEVVWIACDTCELWYHASCVGLSAQQVSKIESYECDACKQPKKKRAPAKRGKRAAEGDEEASSKRAKGSSKRGKKQQQEQLRPPEAQLPLDTSHHEDEDEEHDDDHTEATPVSMQQIQEEDFRKITDMWLSGNQILNQAHQQQHHPGYPRTMPPQQQVYPGLQPQQLPPQLQQQPEQHLAVKPPSPQRKSASPNKVGLEPPSPQRRSASPMKDAADPVPPPVTSNSYSHNADKEEGNSASSDATNGDEDISAEPN